MTAHSGTLVHWIIDGKRGTHGYFQKWALPVPGDHVRILPGEPEEQLVEILFREFEQPEADLPRIWIYASTIAA